MGNQAIGWWVAAAVVLLFLLGLGAVSAYTALVRSSVAGLITSLTILFVALVAATVALYWHRER